MQEGHGRPQTFFPGSAKFTGGGGAKNILFAEIILTNGIFKYRKEIQMKWVVTAYHNHHHML